MPLQLLLDYLTGQMALVNVPTATTSTVSGGWGLLLCLRNLE